MYLPWILNSGRSRTGLRLQALNVFRSAASSLTNVESGDGTRNSASPLSRFGQCWSVEISSPASPIPPFQSKRSPLRLTPGSTVGTRDVDAAWPAAARPFAA